MVTERTVTDKTAFNILKDISGRNHFLKRIFHNWTSTFISIIGPLFWKFFDAPVLANVILLGSFFQRGSRVFSNFHIGKITVWLWLCYRGKFLLLSCFLSFLVIVWERKCFGNCTCMYRIFPKILFRTKVWIKFWL